MVTKEQAEKANEFHTNDCSRVIGPRGGVREESIVWRRNGKTQTWKTRPNAFRIPVKYGMYEYCYITDRDAHFYHAAEDCPLLDPLFVTGGTK